MPEHGKKIGDILEGQLGKLVSDINLTICAKEIYSRLPPPYPTNVSHVVALRNKQLVIRANNSAAIARLRFTQESLIKTLGEHGLAVEAIKILPQPT